MKNNYDILQCANCNCPINIFQYDIASRAYLHDCCTLFCCIECAQKYCDFNNLTYRPISYHDISFYQDCILIASGVKDSLINN